MRNITILGAGKSSIALIDYLVQHSQKEEWEIVVCDVSGESALQKTKGRSHTHALALNVEDADACKEIISEAGVVISMLPPGLHPVIAKDCLALKKNLVTPSYVSEAMLALNYEADTLGLTFMNETGLDPGLDHMSAMEAIERLKSEGAAITGFKSHCGGLVAPESDSNRWHYKFTWNPRNVVLAGKGEGEIQYKENGALVKLNYENLFSSAQKIGVEGLGQFESYPNRDSLKYAGEYGLQDAATMYRGTLRIPPFCEGWACLVKLGLTGEEEVPFSSIMKDKAQVLSFLNISEGSQEYSLLKDIEIFESLPALGQGAIRPAEFLLKLLAGKWSMKPGDKDWVVMVHEISFQKGKKSFRFQSSLSIVGENEERTAMALTVGLPLGMMAKMLVNNQIKRKGVLIPKYPEIYNPILAELKEYKIAFKERVIED